MKRRAPPKKPRAPRTKARARVNTDTSSALPVPAPNDAKCTALVRVRENSSALVPVKASAGGVTVGIEADRLAVATGTASSHVGMHLLEQVGGALTGTGPRRESESAEDYETRMVLAANHGIDALQSIAPKDGVEGMFAAQLVGLHELAMAAMARAQRSEDLERRERHTRNATRLSTAFVAHTEAFKRWRTGGTQRVVVERVDVHPGGQAVVGHIGPIGGGGGGDEH